MTSTCKIYLARTTALYRNSPIPHTVCVCIKYSELDWDAANEFSQQSDPCQAALVWTGLGLHMYTTLGHAW